MQKPIFLNLIAPTKFRSDQIDIHILGHRLTYSQNLKAGLGKPPSSPSLIAIDCIIEIQLE